MHIGEITDNDDFRPWIRLWAPNGTTLGSQSGLAAAAIGDVVAPVTGTYLVLVSSFDSGFMERTLPLELCTSRRIR